MFITHTNSVYSEEITLLDHLPWPQYVHQVANGGGMVVERGIKTMPAELIDYVLKGKHGAAEGTVEFIQELLATNARVGLILAAGGTSWTGYTSNIPRTDKYPICKVPPMGATQVFAGYLANRLGSFEYISTDCTSCISGHSAWYTANNMLKLGLLDAMVVISSDNGLSEEYLAIFGEHGLSKSVEEEDTDIVKFRVGHGCNITIFEGVNHLAAVKRDPIAIVTDMHLAAETHVNPLGISDTGAGYEKVITAVDTTGIDFVKTHSTFSEDNKVEEKLVKAAFGDIRLVNYKLRIGHTMGSSTAIETALAIQEEQGKFLSLGAGMGNVFSSAVVEIIK